MASSPPAAGTPAVSRRAWLFVTGALAESFLVCPIVGWFLARGRAEGSGRPLPIAWFVVGAALLLGGVALTRTAARSAAAAAFLRGTTVAMAVLEANALLGLALSIGYRALAPALLFPALSLAVALLVVLPCGLAFFRERSASGGIEPS